MALPSASEGLSILPLPDPRGWTVIEVQPLPETTIFRMELRSGNGDWKDIELVSQKSLLRVYVSPGLNQPDEWEIPAGSGNKFLVISPPPATGTEPQESYECLLDWI